MIATIDMELAERVLTKEELMVLNIIIGKVQDYEGISQDTLNEYDEYDDNKFRKQRGLPPLHSYGVYYTNGEENMNSFVTATDDTDAVTKWVSKCELDGEIRLDKGTWYYNGCKVHVERYDD